MVHSVCKSPLMGTSMSQFSLDPNQIVDVDVYIDVDVDLGLEILDVVDFIFVIFFVRRSCETLLDHEYFVYKLSYSLRIKHKGGVPKNGTLFPFFLLLQLNLRFM